MSNGRGVRIDNYGLLYQPVSGTISIILPNPREQSINELTQADLENILEVVKELCEKE